MKRKTKTETDERTGKVTVVSSVEPPKEVMRTRNQVQSRMLTTASYSCSLYAQRIKYKIVERLNHTYLDVRQKMNNNAEDIRNELLRMANNTQHLQLTFSIQDLTGVVHYERRNLKKALEELYAMSFDCEYGETIFDEETQNLVPSINHVFRMLSSYTIDMKNNKVFIALTPTAYRIILDFSRLYSVYDLAVIRQFENKYTCRFYELLYSLDKKKPLTYSLDKLKKMFMIEDKHSRPSNFINKVVKPAMEEIERYSPKMFDWKECRSSEGRGRAKITGVTFFAKDNPNVKYIGRHKDIFDNAEKKQALKENRISIAQALPNDVLHTLQTTFSFKDEEIHNNASLLNLWVHYTTEGERSVIFARIASQADVKDYKKYTIGVIKNEVSILEEKEKKRKNFESQTPRPITDEFTMPYDNNELPF